MQAGDDQDHDQDDDDGDCRNGTAEAAWPVVDAVHRLVAAPGHERAGDRLGTVLVVERDRLGRVRHGGGGTGGTSVWPGSVRRTAEEPETRNVLAG